MKKFLSILLVLSMILSFAACSNTTPAANDSYTVGICQLVQHAALDKATEGFKAALSEKLGDKVKFIEQNASGDAVNCSTICNQFVSENVDLIMANATAALQAAAAATDTIPVVGTSISHYATALEIENWTGKVGGNITGTSDLAPLDQQAEMIKELFPDAKTIGILYCSAEANSVFQSDTIKGFIEDLGYEVKVFTFADSNDVASVTTTACAESDVIFIPTDNTAASCAETINNVCLPAGVPVINGEKEVCKACGVAALSIDYYDIGYAAGLMACDILEKGTNAGDMEIQYAPEVEKVFNKNNCDALGITIPEGYVAIED